MNKSFKFWGAVFLIASSITLLSPEMASTFGDGLTSETMAFSCGGPLGLGYDYIGRPILPQILSGGRDLLLASILTAFLSRILGFACGAFLAYRQERSSFLRMFLDVLLVLPAAVVSLASYQAFNGSVYAIVPVACFLTLPFSSRYYAKLIQPILQSGFFIYASLRETSMIRLMVEEVLPILSKNVLTDLSQIFISSIYMLSSITFLGNLAGQGKFLWPQMIANNLSGFPLNPWACLTPLIAILSLTVPLGNCVDSLERRKL